MLNPCSPAYVTLEMEYQASHMLDRMPTTETFPQPYWCCLGYLCHHCLDRSICVSLTSQPILAFWKLPWRYVLCILEIFPFASQMLFFPSLFSSLWVLGFMPLISSFLCTHSIPWQCQCFSKPSVFVTHRFIFWEHLSPVLCLCLCVYGFYCFWMTIKLSQIMF